MLTKNVCQQCFSSSIDLYRLRCKNKIFVANFVGPITIRLQNVKNCVANIIENTCCPLKFL